MPWALFCSHASFHRCACHNKLGRGVPFGNSNFTSRDIVRAHKLYCIAKDMDGLDRVRFNGLDFRPLRTPYARRLPLVAGGLLEEPLLECIENYRAGKLEVPDA